jgi:putative ABC transport system permease protein
MSAGYSPRSSRFDAALARAVFRIALLATPRDARRLYGVTMRADFAIAYERTREDDGAFAAVGYAFVASADAFGSGILERFATIGRDVGYALRVARKTPTISALIVATMAIAIGLNVSADSAMTHLFFGQLPFAEAASLAHITETNTSSGGNWALTYDDAQVLRRELRTARMTFIEHSNGTLRSAHTTPALVSGISVSGEFFDVLRIRPEVGRTLTIADERSRAPVVILSSELWRHSFGGDPRILGRVVTIDDRPRTVVGIVPVGTQTPDRWRGGIASFAYYQPMTDEDRTVGHQYLGIARLNPGRDARALDADLARIFAALALRNPQTNGGFSARSIPVADEILGAETKTVAGALSGAVLIVLAIACANIANLFLARGSARAGEIAIRYSLGATRPQIVAQLLTESAAYSLIGGLLGFGVAAAAIPLFDAMVRSSFTFVHPIIVDAQTVLITVGFIVVTALLAGFVPAIALSRPDLSIDLKAAGRTGSQGAGGRMRAALVCAEIAAVVAIVIVAGLTLRTLEVRIHEPMGFSVDGRYIVQINGLSSHRYGGPAATQRRSYDRFADAIRSTPGTDAVASSMAIPNWSNSDTSVKIESQHYKPGSEPEIAFNIVSANFFATMNTPMLLGRAFTERDGLDSQPVAIVNAAYADAFLGGPTRAIGKRITIGFATAGVPITARTIVGVASNIRSSVQHEMWPAVYMPFNQMPSVVGGITFIVRSSADPQTIASGARAAVAHVDPQQTPPVVRSLATLLDLNLRAMWYADALLGTLATIALVLALGGVVAVVSYSIARRRHEIGIRLALGSTARAVILMMMRSIVLPIAAGAAVGVALASLAVHALDGTLISSELLSPLDELALVALVVTCIAVATYIPAHRAARVDPLVALRYE